MVKQIFVGGTGRSGTTIISKILGEHKDIYSYPFETRFIIDPHGLIDLVPALSDNWSPWKGDVAVRQFKRMMWQIYPPTHRWVMRGAEYWISRRVGCVFSPPAYFNLYIRNIIPREKFVGLIEKFVNALVDREFPGYWIGSDEQVLFPKIISTKKFERKEIMKISSNLVNSISEYPMENNGKKIWLDHTPFNLIHASFLYEMFPDMKLIHICRDLRDVISSYNTKNWGAGQPLDIILWIKQIFEKWEVEKKRIPKDRYYEMKMEDLIKKPERTLRELTDFIGIEFDKKVLDIDLSKGHIGRWKKYLKPEEKRIIDKNLENILKRYEYTI